MAMHDESGDVVGIEIFVVYSRTGYHAVFQASEGEPEPVVAAATIERARIAFHLPPGAGYSGVFRGEIRNGELTGAFEGGQTGSHGEERIRLERGSSYWQ